MALDDILKDIDERKVVNPPVRRNVYVADLNVNVNTDLETPDEINYATKTQVLNKPKQEYMGLKECENPFKLAFNASVDSLKKVLDTTVDFVAPEKVRQPLEEVAKGSGVAVASMGNLGYSALKIFSSEFAINRENAKRNQEITDLFKSGQLTEDEYVKKLEKSFNKNKELGNILREDVAKEVKADRDNFNQWVQECGFTPDTKVGQFFFDFGATITSLGLSVASFAIAKNPMLAISMISLPEFTQSYIQATEEEKGTDTAMKSGLSNYAFIVGTEYLGGKILWSTLTKSGFVNKAIRQIAKKSPKTAISFVAGVEEGFQETTQTFGTELINEYYDISQLSRDEIIAEALYNGFQATIGAFLFGAVASNLNFDTIITKEKESLLKLKDVNGKKLYTPQQADTIARETANYIQNEQVINEVINIAKNERENSLSKEARNPKQIKKIIEENLKKIETLLPTIKKELVDIKDKVKNVALSSGLDEKQSTMVAEMTQARAILYYNAFGITPLQFYYLNELEINVDENSNILSNGKETGYTVRFNEEKVAKAINSGNIGNVIKSIRIKENLNKFGEFVNKLVNEGKLSKEQRSMIYSQLSDKLNELPTQAQVVDRVREEEVEKFNQRDSNYYERQARNVELKNKDNREILLENGGTEEQADELENLGALRHRIHSINVNSLAVGDNYDIKELDLGNISSKLEEVGLFSISTTESPLYTTQDTDDVIADYLGKDIDNLTKEDKEKFNNEVVEMWAKWKEKVNNEIEDYLSKIDTKYKTHYKPTGALRENFYQEEKNTYNDINDFVKDTYSDLTEREDGPKKSKELDKLKSIEIKNVTEFKTVKELKKFLNDVLEGLSELKVDETGQKISISKSRVKRSLKNARNNINNQVYNEIEDLVRNSKYLGFKKADSRHTKVKGQDLFLAKMKIGEDEYLVEFRADVPLAEKKLYYAGHKIQASVSDTVITPLLKQKPTNNIIQNNENVNRGEVIPRDINTPIVEQTKSIINVFQSGDKSTIIHEMAHIFLRDIEVIENQGGVQDEQFKKIKKTLDKWLGKKEGQKYTTEQQEKFAQGFETYMATGQAPKEELKSVFDYFKKWMSEIYNGVKNMIPITPEVKNMFDEILTLQPTNNAIQTQTEGGNGGNGNIMNTPQTQEGGGGNIVPVTPDAKDLGKIDNKKGFIKSATDVILDAIEPVSTRLGAIDTRLDYEMKMFEARLSIRQKKYKDASIDFLQQTDKLKATNNQDYLNYDRALKNSDINTINRINEKYPELKKAYEKVRQMLDSIKADLEIYGVSSSVENYFPRKIANIDGLVSYLEGNKDWSDIERAMKKKDPNYKKWSEEEKAEFVASYLSGYQKGVTNASSHTKQRKIMTITDEIDRYYENSNNALLEYIADISNFLEVAKLLRVGKDKAYEMISISKDGTINLGEVIKNIESLLGTYVKDLVKDKKITREQEKKIADLLRARFNFKNTNNAVSSIKSVGYLATLGNINAVITQFGDLAYSIDNAGVFGVLKALFGKKKITMQDIGIDHPAEDFKDGVSLMQKVVDKVLTATGFTKIDSLGKNTFIATTFMKYKNAIEKNEQKVYDDISRRYGEEFAKDLISDLKNDVMSDNIFLFAHTELARVQPISLSEMPKEYLTHPVNRIFYSLKTFWIKQFNRIVTDNKRLIQEGVKENNNGKIKEGATSMARLIILFMVLGSGTDMLKDLIYLRKIDLEDTVFDNFLKILGISRYTMYKGREEGYGRVVLDSIFNVPVMQMIDSFMTELGRARNGKIKLKDLRIASNIPIIGNPYYWWVGGGRTKEKKKNKRRVL